MFFYRNKIYVELRGRKLKSEPITPRIPLDLRFSGDAKRTAADTHYLLLLRRFILLPSTQRVRNNSIIRGQPGKCTIELPYLAEIPSDNQKRKRINQFRRNKTRYMTFLPHLYGF